MGNVMTSKDIIKTLRDETMNSDGAFVLLRLGEDPGIDRILRMRKALRIIWEEFALKAEIPHELAFICGMIIHFSRECRGNLQDKPEAVRDRLLASVEDLALGAFEVLAGDRAREWTIPRSDLGERASVVSIKSAEVLRHDQDSKGGGKRGGDL